LLIKGEEISLNLDGFIQPFKEQRDALEHIIRARASELDIVKDIEDTAKYITGNLEKALGHEYRAFFDIADWVGIIIREKVTELMSPYSHECISRVFPLYYIDIRPKLERANLEIADLRNNKDLPKTENIVPGVEKYHAVINELTLIISDIAPFIPQLEECKASIRKTKAKGIIRNIGLVVLGAFLTVIFTILFNRYYCK
jgi:hypothetical protein